MSRAKNGAVEIEYETFGDDQPETVILINGLGSQMTRWPEAFCALHQLTGEGRWLDLAGQLLDTAVEHFGDGRGGFHDTADDAEVLVTRPVVERAGSHLEFTRIAEVRLKGFTESTEIFLASQQEEE